MRSTAAAASDLTGPGNARAGASAQRSGEPTAPRRTAAAQPTAPRRTAAAQHGAAGRHIASRALRAALASTAALVTPLAVLTAVAAPAASAAPRFGALRAKAQAPAPKKVSVRLEKSAKYGQILVDQAGQALYTDKADKPPAKWACKGGCLSAWPPLVLPKGQAAVSHAASLQGLGVVQGPSGRQVTWHGHPLYSFAGDKPGQVKGQGILHVWYVAQVPAVKTKAAGSGGTGGSGSW